MTVTDESTSDERSETELPIPQDYIIEQVVQNYHPRLWQPWIEEEVPCCSSDLVETAEPLGEPKFLSSEADTPALNCEVESEDLEKFTKENLSNEVIAADDESVEFELLDPFKPQHNIDEVLVPHTGSNSGDPSWTYHQTASSSGTQRGISPGSSETTHESKQQKVCPHYRCEVCEKIFKNEYAFKMHERKHTGKNPSCSTCGKSFVKGLSLKLHMKLHEEKNPGDPRFSCDRCNMVFDTKIQFNTHRRRSKPLSCGVCGERFCSRRFLERHERIHESKPHPCDSCEMKFRFACELKKHRRKHTGEKPFTCEVCGKPFAREEDLVYHMRGHSDEKPFSCQMCGEAFKQEKSLKSHLISHSDDTPWLCEICGWAYKRRSSLRAHLMSHAINKPYLCEICGRNYVTKQNLNFHRQKAHNGEGPSVTESYGSSSRVESDEMMESGAIGPQQRSFQTLETEPAEFNEIKYERCSPQRHVAIEFEVYDSCWESRQQCKEEQKPVRGILVGESFSSGQSAGPSTIDEEGRFHGLQGEMIPKEEPRSSEEEGVVYEFVESKDPLQVKDEGGIECSSTNSGDPLRITGEQSSDLERQEGNCARSFDEIIELRHCNDGSRWRCEFCKKSYEIEYAYKMHIRRHTRENPSCSICGKSYTKGKRLRNHMKTHEREQPGQNVFSCTLCSRRFQSKVKLNAHSRYHKRERMFLCKVCNQEVRGQRNFLTHNKKHLRKTPERYSPVCDICGTHFKTEYTMGIHRRTHADMSRTSPCEFCGRSFYQESSLNLHMKQHADVDSGTVDHGDITMQAGPSTRDQTHGGEEDIDIEYHLDKIKKEMKREGSR
ncbi:hypothetical protein QAD02_015142 [Eretmocerus hayati]|uniref:Uncharacterized protein n=1 Tax=Eretmocerus hayati TaxID=131215 RepID=A0ACC2P7G4_9HYME|nr:hypothetical protein QAD02_015142 [Eretmocerus hayati]